MVYLLPPVWDMGWYLNLSLRKLSSQIYRKIIKNKSCTGGIIKPAKMKRTNSNNIDTLNTRRQGVTGIPIWRRNTFNTLNSIS